MDNCPKIPSFNDNFSSTDKFNSTKRICNNSYYQICNNVDEFFVAIDPKTRLSGILNEDGKIIVPFVYNCIHNVKKKYGLLCFEVGFDHGTFFYTFSGKFGCELSMSYGYSKLEISDYSEMGFVTISHQYEGRHAPGKDGDDMYERFNIHLEHGLLVKSLFLEGEMPDVNSYLKPGRFGTFLLDDKVYNSEFRCVYSLEKNESIKSKFLFDNEDQTTTIYKEHNVLVQLVDDDVYFIADMGLGHLTRTEGLPHVSSMVTLNGNDIEGNKLVDLRWRGKVISPTVLDQYLVSEYDKRIVTDKYGNTICEGRRLLDINMYFYLMSDKGFSMVYNIYGDEVFRVKESEKIIKAEIPSGLKYVEGDYIDSQIFLQDNRTFILCKTYGYRASIYYLYDHKGSLLTAEGYATIYNFQCNMAYAVDFNGKEGFLTYVDGNVEFIPLPSEMKKMEFDRRFKNDLLKINGITYDKQMNVVENRDNNTPSTISKFEKAFGIQMILMSDLGNGLYWGKYTQPGVLDLHGNVTWKQEIPLPYVNEKSSPSLKNLCVSIFRYASR